MNMEYLNLLNSLILLIRVLWFSSHICYIFLVRPMLKSFFWGSVNVNGSTFLILNSTCSSLVQAYLGDIVDLVSNHHNKENKTI